MSIQKNELSLTTKKTYDGWNVYLSHASKTELVAENYNFNPVNGLKKINSGFQFRARLITIEQLADALDAFEHIESDHNLLVQEIIQEGSKPYLQSYVRIVDRNEASMFALNQLEVFQKWSDAQEDLFQKELANPTQHITVDKNGIARGVTITITTLDE